MCFVKNLVILLPPATDKTDITNKGIPIPTPNTKKLIKFVRKPIVDELIANKTVIDAGLQGSIISPKNAPNNNALMYGFFAFGVLTSGNNLEKLKLKINIIETIPIIPKAMGEIIPIIFVKDVPKIAIKISPNKNIEIITPNVTNNPSIIAVFLCDLFSLIWFDRNARNPG